MIRLFSILVLIFLNLSLWSQDAIRGTDPVQQQKAIIVIPSITTQQLESIKTEFASVSQITQAVYVYKNHNCLLVNLGNDGDIKFYGDLLKLIIKATGLTEQDMSIKTPEAYSEIVPMDLGDESPTNFIVK
jgi:hypothetical protein